MRLTPPGPTDPTRHAEPDRRRLTAPSRLMAAAIVLLLAAAGCSSPGGTSTPVGSEPQNLGTKVASDSANFVDPRMNTNPFHPLKPGTQWVYGGTTEVGSRTVPHGIVVTITDVVRDIDGVRTVAMLGESTDSGEVSQVGMDYMALDKDGNVWILGGYTEEFEGGKYTNTETAWLGTAQGQAIGILSPHIVDISTPRWFIGAAPQEAGAVGEPVRVGVRECVKFGCFDNVRVVQEGEVNAPDNEHKYYAPGVGVIRNVPLNSSLHKDRFELLNFLELSSEGLAESSQSVLDLEAHARKTAAEVYGTAPPATRSA